jgi:hypothetical protein
VSESPMGSLDLLMLSSQAALALRCVGNPDEGIAAGYKFLRKRPPQDAGDDQAVRIARLMSVAGERRADLLHFLWSRPKSVSVLNRPDDGTEELTEPDPEARRLYEQVINARRGVKHRDMMGDGFGSFRVALRECAGHFGGRWTKGKGGWIRFKPKGLPEKVRGLIDYPLEVPVLFPIEVGKEPWSLWRICCAFAEQYVRIYEHPDRYGVWGHDLADLWIERLAYYPKHRLIWPTIGS